MSTVRFVFISLLLLAAFFVHSVHAEDMPPLENYTPPPGLFEGEPIPDENAPTPFLTTIEKPKPKAVAPQLPKKPVKPVVAKKSKGKNDGKKSTKKKTSIPKKSTGVKPGVAAPVEPVLKSVTQLEEGQRLAHPTAQDVLESISGLKSTKKTGEGKMSLLFMSGSITLGLDMKNTLLNDYIPALQKTQEKRVFIQAYAPDSEGGMRRLSQARAEETRDFLTAAGIDSDRIMVMPLGNPPDDASLNRIDLISGN